MLAARPLPRGELVKRLQRKGHARDATEAAVSALEAAGIVDDGAFARHFARTRARRFRYGPGRLVADLRRLGVASDIAEAAVAEALEQEGVDPRQLVREAAQKKLKGLAGLAPPVRRRRLVAYLSRRGFARSDVVEVVKEALQG
jgi:regulatory protein